MNQATLAARRGGVTMMWKYKKDWTRGIKAFAGRLGLA